MLELITQETLERLKVSTNLDKLVNNNNIMIFLVIIPSRGHELQ